MTDHDASPRKADDVFVVTGAGSGIGRATVIRLLSPGRTVLAIDLDKRGLAGTRDLAAERPGKFVAQVADVSDDSACAAVVATVQTLGSLSGIVNCAGIMPAGDHVETLSPDDWDRTFAVNVRPIFLLARRGLKLMRPNGGVIVNVASVHAYASTPATSSYAASKGAIVALTHQLSLDLARDGVRVVAVAPGSVDTPMSYRAAQRSGVASLSDLGFSTSHRSTGRIGTAAEVANVIDWLTTPAAAFVNGTVIRADGALLAAIPTAHSNVTAREGPQL